MKLWPFILLLLGGCATAVSPTATVPPPNLLDQPHVQFDSPLTKRTQSVIAPPPIVADDPPPGVVIPLASSSAPSDFFTTTNLGSPWIYRTDDLRLVTNADGTTSGSFTNSPPTTQEFYLIVPLGQPLPSNIVTNL